MVSIFYGSTFLHRSQLLCIINRALHPFARATHPLSLSLPSCSPLLLFSLAAAANLTNRIILRRGLNGFRSILNTPSPLLEYVARRRFLSLFLPFFFSNIENRLCIANLIRVIANAQSIERPWEIPFAYTIGITV